MAISNNALFLLDGYDRAWPLVADLMLDRPRKFR